MLTVRLMATKVLPRIVVGVVPAAVVVVHVIVSADATDMRANHCRGREYDDGRHRLLW